MDRADHLQWAKNRAYEYCDSGDVNEAFASFLSDMHKHPELADHLALEMMVQMRMGGQLQSPSAMRTFIEGFN